MLQNLIICKSSHNLTRCFILKTFKLYARSPIESYPCDVRIREFLADEASQRFLELMPHNFRRFVHQLDCLVGIDDVMKLHGQNIFILSLDMSLEDQIPVSFWGTLEREVAEAIADSYEISLQIKYSDENMLKTLRL